MDSPFDWLLFDKDWLVVELSSCQTANHLVLVAESLEEEHSSRQTANHLVLVAEANPLDANHLEVNHCEANNLEADHVEANHFQANHLVVVAEAQQGYTKQERHAIKVTPGQKDSEQQNAGLCCQLDSSIVI